MCGGEGGLFFLCFYLIAISTSASNKSKRENKETRVVVIGHRGSQTQVVPIFIICRANISAMQTLQHISTDIQYVQKKTFS